MSKKLFKCFFEKGGFDFFDAGLKFRFDGKLFERDLMRTDPSQDFEIKKRLRRRNLGNKIPGTWLGNENIFLGINKTFVVLSIG